MIEEFETMSSQLSSALGGTISTMVTFHVVGGGDDDDDASVLALKRKISGGSTTTQFPMCGASAFKFKPGFFEISPVDVLSLKFVSNLLGLDDSATVKDAVRGGITRRWLKGRGNSGRVGTRRIAAFSGGAWTSSGYADVW